MGFLGCFRWVGALGGLSRFPVEPCGFVGCRPEHSSISFCKKKGYAKAERNAHAKSFDSSPRSLVHEDRIIPRGGRLAIRR